MIDKTERLKRLDDNKLIDVVKNYRQYGYDIKLRNVAISILEERGIDKTHLLLTGNFDNHTYESAKDIYVAFGKNSKNAFIFYLVALTTNTLVSIINVKSETLALIILMVSFISLILFFIYLIKSFIKQNQFYKIVGKEYGSEGVLIYLFLGVSFYLFLFFYFRNQMNAQMKLIK